MPRQKRADFFEEVERIEQVLNQLLAAERDAFLRMIDAPAGPAKSAALSSYRRAAGAQKKAVDRRQKFLDKNRP
jgi:ATP/maltotriose-dependent transcriptional regulator MalT